MLAVLLLLTLVLAVPVLFRLPCSVLLNFFTGARRGANASRNLPRADLNEQRPRDANTDVR
jgi:hypothetical protein